LTSAYGLDQTNLKLELDDQERRTVGRSLVERRARLIEIAEDTTQPRAAQQSGLRELAAVASVLRRLRRANRANKFDEQTCIIERVKAARKEESNEHRRTMRRGSSDFDEVTLDRVTTSAWSTRRKGKGRA
jgi:hypothetical protein